MLKAELAEREVRSPACHRKAARFPAYKDPAGFDFAASEINEATIRTLHRRKVRVFSTIERVNALEQEKAKVKAGQIAESLTRFGLVIPDELGYLPFSASDGASPFHLLSKLYERTSVVITTNLSFSEGATAFGDAQMTTTLPDHLTHRCHILETGNDSFRCKASAAAVARKMKDTNHALAPT